MSRLPILFAIAAVLPAVAAEKPLPLGAVRFEENRGQADPAVRFLARARGQHVFLTDTGVVFSPPRGRAVAMRFAGAGKCRWTPAGSASDSISYYVGNDPSKWVKMAPMFDRVVWHDAWPGVDVAFYGDGDRLEYDLVLAPGADPSRIQIQFDRPAKPRVQADGTVEIVSEANAIRQRVPDIWQENRGGERSRVGGSFVAYGRNGLRLKLSPYERSRTVIVDPVLERATYLGGENDDEVIAVAEGVVAGNTRSVAFPPSNANLRPSRDIFIRGTASTSPVQDPRFAYFGTVVIGGSGDDQLAGIAVSTIAGFGFYVAGTTTSRDFPAGSSSLALKYNGGASDGFVAFITVSQAFANLAYAVYVGGSGEDTVTSFTGNGSIFAMAGVTDSADIPAPNAPQQALAGGKDAFYAIVTQFFGTNLLYGYLGGTGDDAAYAVAIRNSASIWIGGQTSSPDFPFAGGLAGPSDAFLAELSTPVSFVLTNAPITVNTWRIGGNGDDSIRALVASPQNASTVTTGNRVVTPFILDGIGFAGVTTSTDLPVLNASQPRPGGDRDGFAGMWDRRAAAPRWLTYLGGSGPDEATAIARTWAGDLYVAGITASTDLPVLNALQQASAGAQDGMFAAFDNTGALQHLTYFGGSGDDRVQGISVLPNLDARLVGSTTSADLPQRQVLQDRGGAMDGFLADVGSDYFIGPANLVLAKDGVITFSVRAARTAFRPPVTYQSSDPSRVRLSYLGRSFEQVTAAAEDNMAVEALADNGEADILITSPGFASKTLHLKLYPGAFVSGLSTSPPLTTWSTNLSVFANYCPFDQATGAVAGLCMNLRSGIPQPVFHWSTSDSSVFRINDTGAAFAQLQVLQAGAASLSLAVDGYTVVQGTQNVTVAAPSPVAPANDFHLGRDLSANLPISFTANGANLFSGYQGTLTARSGDPSRLLLSLDPNQPGVAQVSLTMSGRSPAVWAQALADDGVVPVYLSLSGVDGETPLNVVLEPAVLRWGVTQAGPTGGTVFGQSISLTTAQAPTLTLALQGISGFGGQMRPGADPPTLTLSNSNPRAVELNRLTLTLGSNGSYTLRGVAPGSSALTLAVSNPGIQPLPATLPVIVQAVLPVLPTFGSNLYVGNGLQTAVPFSYVPTAATAVTVSVDNPSVALVSSSLSVRGASTLTLASSGPNSNEYTFWLQGQGSSGSTTVRVRFPEGERTFTVNLLPSGAGFVTLTSASSRDYAQGARVAAYALDRTTGIGLFQQTPQPGAGMPVHFSAEAPVQLAMASAVLTAGAPQRTLEFTLPPAGQQSLITVTTDGNPSVAAITSTLKVGTASSDPAVLNSVVVPRGGLGQVSVTGVPLPATVTTSDPQNLLVSASATEPGAASVELQRGASLVYIHALGDSGSYTLQVDPAGAASSIIQVGLQPLQLNVNSFGTSVPIGETNTFSASLNAGILRPGVGPYHFTAQTANGAIATVTPPEFDLGAAGTTISLKVVGVSPGTTQLTVAGPTDVYIVPSTATITVPATPPAPALPAYTLGVNLQGAVQIDLGANFSNPNGTIVTLSSSNPDVLLLSRAATTVGTNSVVVAAAAGTHLTQLIYLQGLKQGSATIQMAVNGSPQSVATVAITPSWVSCGVQPVSINAGATQSVSCSVRYNAQQSFALQEVGPRAGLPDLTLNLSSSAPDIFTVTPTSGTLGANSIALTLNGVAPGTAFLKVIPPSVFGPSPDGSEAVMVTVTQPPITTACGTEIVLGMDTQYTCTFNAGGVVTATSSDATLLLVSTDEKAAGGPAASIASSNRSASFTFQARAAYGTVEVVFSAPGYRDLRIAIALRPSTIALTSSLSPFSLRVGNSGTVNVAIRMGGTTYPTRAGANVTVDLTTDQPGIVSLSPARVVLSGPNSPGDVRVNAQAAGSTLLRMNVPTGYLTAGTPLAVSVAP